MFPSFPHWKHCFQCQFSLSRRKLCLRYTGVNFNENPSMRRFGNILRARASEQSSKFCEQFQERPNFASTFRLDGTIRYPSLGECMFCSVGSTNCCVCDASRNVFARGRFVLQSRTVILRIRKFPPQDLPVFQ